MFEKMKIFWSWQSDTNEKCGHYFVRDVLDAVARDLNVPDGVDEVERGEDIGPIVVDHDTKDVAGSPPIAETILKKIRDAAVFVADVTPVGVTTGGKRLANPNVMFELGYAVHALSHERIVLVMNKAEHAQLDTLPFDLRHLRGPVTYNLPQGAESALQKEQKELFGNALKARIRPSLAVAAEAMREAERQTKPRPKFMVEFVATEGEIPESVSQVVVDLGAPSLEQIKTQYPLLSIPSDAPSASYRPKGLHVFMAPPRIPLKQWTKEETLRYNQRLENYYRCYESYLTELLEYRKLCQRTIKVSLFLENFGDCPSNDIDIYLKVPEMLRLFESDELPQPPEEPERPILNPNPELFIRARPAPVAVGRLGSTSKEYWTYVDTKNRSVRFHVQKLKHGHTIRSESFALAYARSEDIGEVELPYSMTCDELPVLNGVIKLSIRCVDPSVL